MAGKYFEESVCDDGRKLSHAGDGPGVGDRCDSVVVIGAGAFLVLRFAIE